MTDLVRFEQVSKTYAGERLPAVDRLDLSLERGSFVTLLGPSGCGKSTTLRMLGGFETPDSGRILLSGQDVTALQPNRRDVNMVFQDYALFPHLTVARNIAFGLELKGLPREEIRRRVEELLDLVELRPFADRKPAALSGGQRQRAALARALAPDPAVLLLDEPLAALDAKLREQMQEELKALQQRTRKTFLFVTHDQEEALVLSDVIVVMNGGRIEQQGTPEELYHRPSSRFVAGFIGTASRIDGTVSRLSGGQAAIAAPGLADLAGRAGEGSLAAGRAATLFLRPEDVEASRSRPSGENGLPATVAGRRFAGGRVSFTLDIGQGREVTAFAGPSLPDAAPGEQVWLSFAAERAVVFTRPAA